MDITGILFFIVPTETAGFNITITPEFPSASILVLTALTAAYLIIHGRVKTYYK